MITSICDILDQSIIGFGSLNERVRVTKQLEPISVDADAAIPIGLIVTELLTNAFKYAFPAGAAVRFALVSHRAQVMVKSRLWMMASACRRSVAAAAFASCKRWYPKSTVISS